MAGNLPEDFTTEAQIDALRRRIEDLERAPRLHNASIGAGGLTVVGGQIIVESTAGDELVTLDEDGLQTYEPDGSVLSVLDGARLRFNRSNGSRILEVTPAGGLKIYAANGTTELVVLDGDGLSIDGVLQPALAVLTDSDSGSPSVTTSSFSTVGQLDFSIPSWADEVSLIIIARAQNTTTPSGNWGFFNRLVNDVGGLDHTTDDFVRVESTGVSINSSTVALTTTVSAPGSTVTCRQQMQTSGGNLDFETRIEGIAIVRRT